MKKSVFLVFSFAFALSAIAQKKAANHKPDATLPDRSVTNPVVFTFAGDTVYKDEFVRLLNKNRKEKDAPSEKEIREYLDLYINFKLKVKEAMNMHLDTASNFLHELAGYRKQLANPYLTDKKVSESLINEAYERMKNEINASHILIICSENASPADTLAAYNKVMDYRRRILKGESFDSLALKYSEDPSAKSNYGNLGWFSVFQMVYPFESGAYKTPKGDVSMPVRSQFGYHLIKVNDMRAARGDVKVAHIMIRVNQNAQAFEWEEARLKADTVYEKLKSALSFDEIVAQYSQDEGSKGNKGVMNWIASLSGYPESFKDACFSLKVGEYSKPFKTEYGYHIVKLLEKRPLGELKEVQDVIKTKINRDTRSESSKASVIARIRKEYKAQTNQENLNAFIKSVDTTFRSGTWSYDEKTLSQKPVFTIGNKSYSIADFAPYVKSNQQELGKGASVSVAIKNHFQHWSDEKCIAYEENNLESKYEDFRNIYKEYHDGILLFDLTDKMVWTKAVTDTMGLEKFYEQNKDHYIWKERLSYALVTCKTADQKNDAMKRLIKGAKLDEVMQKLNKKSAGAISITENKSEKSESIAEKLWNTTGVSEIKNEEPNVRFYYVHGIVAPEVKALKDCKGSVISDYQNELEKNWIKSLHDKYPVSVEEGTIQSLITK